MAKVTPIRGADPKVVPMAGLHQVQAQHICRAITKAIAECTEGDPRDHGFVLIMVTNEGSPAPDGSSRVTVASASTFPSDVSQRIISDWLFKNRN